MESALHLQPRLRAIADQVPPGSRLADIGTDHGYIPVALLLEGRIPSAIAADIGKAPLEHAMRTAECYSCTERIQFRLGNGLATVAEDETDCIVIAGMGGDKIVMILNDAPWTKNGVILLLQPMSKADVLRTWLSENGYAVVSEQLVEDKDTLYPILSVRGGSMDKATEAEAVGGFYLQNDPLWGKYLADYIHRYQLAAASLRNAQDPCCVEKQQRFLRIANVLEEWKGEWELAHRT